VRITAAMHFRSVMQWHRGDAVTPIGGASGTSVVPRHRGQGLVPR
jgi:hypothetical protein